MDTNSLHEDSDSGHSWLTLDEELSDDEDNDSEINAVSSDGETEERREWMKERRPHFDRPKDDDRRPHADLSKDDGRRSHFDRPKNDDPSNGPTDIQVPSLGHFRDLEEQKRAFRNRIRAERRRRSRYQRSLAQEAERTIQYTKSLSVCEETSGSRVIINSKATLNPSPTENSVKHLTDTHTPQKSEARANSCSIPSSRKKKTPITHTHQNSLRSKVTKFVVYLVPSTYPKDFLKQGQFESLSLQILSKIDALPYLGKVTPRFNIAKFWRGSCLLNCADEETKKWVLEILPQLKVDDFGLTSITANQLVHYMKVVAFIAGPPCSSDLIIKRLWVQNPELAVHRWVVHQTRKISVDFYRVVFDIPVTSIPALEKEEFKACYEMKQIRFSFWKPRVRPPKKPAQVKKDILSQIPTEKPVARRSLEPNGENNSTYKEPLM